MCFLTLLCRIYYLIHCRYSFQSLLQDLNYANHIATVKFHYKPTSSTVFSVTVCVAIKQATPISPIKRIDQETPIQRSISLQINQLSNLNSRWIDSWRSSQILDAICCVSQQVAVTYAKKTVHLEQDLVQMMPLHVIKIDDLFHWLMAIIHGLIAHGTTIVAEYKTDKDIDDLTGISIWQHKILLGYITISPTIKIYSCTGYFGEDTT